ncbi:uracil-DNA glycosylase [Polynucleobacter sp. MWH-UH25E]|uniref:uracil-DNA glycosylase n=1 Tax=Polynucleobacter sp. MWH-UH25E TaxID=1855616 RepID=UPI001BFD78A0|nr:uracil-DNA glycosylase [Polynucleobacter sp. MWH-UH25E]QWD62191.1 uracil-DNA glycosylase [Polynucleobacter sp. MWH-UH25E]
MFAFSRELIPQDWRHLLGDYFDTSDWKVLKENIQNELNANPEIIRPEPQNFFKALELTPLDAVKVVILGQDPYHSPGLAQGLAFSIPSKISPNSREFPSSLRNISKALSIEGFGTLSNGDLHHWAEQGVLLLNTALSVKLGEAGSHASLGWKSLIDRLISALSIQKPHLVWMLWGGHAQSKLPLISQNNDQMILQSSHPSGLGVYKTNTPFLVTGDKDSCRHFTKTNDWLVAHRQKPIQWVNSASAKDKQIQGNLFSQG